MRSLPSGRIISARQSFIAESAFLLHSCTKYDRIQKHTVISVWLAMSDSACCAVRHTDAGPVRLGRCEPGQVGNQAALSGVHGAFQPACIRMPSFARRGTTPRRCPYFYAFLPEGGSGHVSCPLPQVAAPAVRGCGGPAGHRGGPEKPDRRRPGGPRLSVHRRARHRQDHLRQDLRQGGQLPGPAKRRPLRPVPGLPWHRRRQHPGRGGDGRRLQQRRGRHPRPAGRDRLHPPSTRCICSPRRPSTPC